MEVVGEEVDYKEIFFSGFFRDGKRRIDLVIVAKETRKKSIETVKMDFLRGAINTGLDLEIETGVNEAVRDLIFIKVHAPDHLIKHFGYYYNMRKFFKKTHVDFIHSNVLEEKELIKIIRRWYPGPINYSTFERSIIVYKILLSVSFGSAENHVGINQLVDKNIFLDVYPLHDGPYYTLSDQSPLQLNGRQALYYNWLGYKNVFRCQPVNLIREYLGERTAFYFAFYGFYNTFLLGLAIVGAMVFRHNYNFKYHNIVLNENGESNHYIYNRQGRTNISYSDLIVCPKCKDFVGCPFRNLSDYARELKCKVFLDNPYNYHFAYFVVIWGILLYLFWRRREHYFHWIWETTEDDAKNLTRPSYRQLPKPKRPPKVAPPKAKTGEKIIKAKVKSEMTPRPRMPSIFNNFVEFWVMNFVLGVFIVGQLYLLISLNNKMLNKLRYVEDLLFTVITDGKEQFNHFVVDFVGSVNGVTILALEYVWFKISKWLTRMHNARTELLYEKYVICNLYGVTIVINFGLIFFFAFFKGSLYTIPHDDERWLIPLGLGVMNCGVLSCIDEIFIVFVATHKAKKCIQEVMCIFENKELVRDNMEQRFFGEEPYRTPCWEREFELRPLTEDFFMEKYNELFLQLALMTLLVTVFPLAPLIAFLWNLFEIKHQARMVLLYSRRPLLVQNWGLGGWRTVLFILPYIAAVTNSLYLARNNSILDRRYNQKYWSHESKRRFIADYYMGFFNVTDQVRSPNVQEDFQHYSSRFNANVPDFCMFPGQYNRLITFFGHRLIFEGKQAEYAARIKRIRIMHINTYMPQAGKWYINWHQALVVLFYLLLSCATGLIIHAVIKPTSGKVRKYQYLEDSVKTYDIIKEMGQKHFQEAKKDQ